MTGFFSRAPKPTESERVQELESELESTRAVLEFTKTSLRVEVQKVDELEDRVRSLQLAMKEEGDVASSVVLNVETGTSPKVSPRLSLPEAVSEPAPAENSASLEIYENRVSALLLQLREEEENHQFLLSQKENRIQELQNAMDSAALAAHIDPSEEARSTVLEERIVEMTILIEEKDRRIFNLQSEIDQLREQISILRCQVDRIPELESTINTLDNTLAGIRRLSEPLPDPVDDGESSSDEDISEKPEDEFVVELRTKISSLETTIMDLDRLVIAMRVEKETMTTERDSAMEFLRQKEEQFRMEMEDVMRTHANEMRVNDETITSLREKIFTLQDQLEVAEMAKMSLTTELEMEQAKRSLLEEQETTTQPTLPMKPEMISRPVSPLPMLTESIPTIAPTPVVASPEMIPISSVTPQMMSPKVMSPKVMSPKVMSPEKIEDEEKFEIETDGGSTLAVSEQVKAIVDRQREQIEELNFELIALRLKVAEEMVSPNNKRIFGDSSKSTPSDQFVVPHRDLVPLSPRMPPSAAANNPISPAGCTGCFPSMFRKQNRNNILV